MVEEPFDHLDCFLDLSVFVYVLVHHSEAVEKRKETFASMCDERARMLQDQFNVSMNHVQAVSIVISTFHYGKRLSAIDQGFRSSLSSANLSFCGLELTCPRFFLPVSRASAIPRAKGKLVQEVTPQ
ncbi:Histidine kinase 3 [Camellia lanceoleosa]|uniref:Histidine kinase 3 n=1 Tax=Camellia lanceoleosa TaxID=1840588 RepID=A0ACC0GJV8_9ERIC|nr:Histidine kinase 3 [Camellia lanceoleosa]